MLLNLWVAEFEASWISISETSSPFIVPNDPLNTEPREEVPKKTNGSAHTSTTIKSLGPVRKFLRDSIIVATL